jgi:hypothetical protein
VGGALCAATGEIRRKEFNIDKQDRQEKRITTMGAKADASKYQPIQEI